MRQNGNFSSEKKETFLPKLICASSDESADILYASGFHAPDEFTYFETEQQKGIVVSPLEYSRACAEAKKGDHAFRRNVQIVFQDPYWSLNPRWLIKDIVAEPLDVYEKLGEAERLARVKELLEMVGIDESACYKYPHEFSGGQRQRIAIARSLASNPKLVVLDEPTSSIDVFSQAQILSLIQELRERFSLTNILISHDLGVVHALADRIAIMYLGKIVEIGPAEEVFTHPRHPYTKALFDSIPTLDKTGMDALKTLEGQIPSPINPPPGCAFHQRCAYACEKCSQMRPEPRDLGGGHVVSCLRVDELEKELAEN